MRRIAIIVIGFALLLGGTELAEANSKRLIAEPIFQSWETPQLRSENPIANVRQAGRNLVYQQFGFYRAAWINRQIAVWALQRPNHILVRYISATDGREPFRFEWAAQPWISLPSTARAASP